jgi:hypothetical protein
VDREREEDAVHRPEPEPEPETEPATEPQTGPEDLAWLQTVLDASYARAGAHLRAIHTDEARLSAAEVVDRLRGMRVFVLATVARDGRPFTGPVDTYLVGGRLHLGTSPEAVRARHLARDPAVSATYAEGEGLVVTVHGRALPVEAALGTPFGDAVVAHHGELGVYAGASTWAIEPDRMFAADMTVHQRSAGPT